MSISDAIVVALIATISQIFVALLQNHTKGVINERKEAARDQYIDDVIDQFDERLDKIDGKIDEHNHYAKKFDEVNVKLTLVQKDIEYLKKEREK